ncbi:hypothetical protein H072_294 [Dactylellina haptotyla CBS 200.50]|uniref:Uncharacterized protein n=1 Tax=Dactylellina haptotyla (strain CBS 200.50) TaxID=1284197 RepID=S8CE08_DACHA|nr:hypothetical protein H072_294 [Dactylellina haptotyla CBS 200.50]
MIPPYDQLFRKKGHITLHTSEQFFDWLKHYDDNNKQSAGCAPKEAPAPPLPVPLHDSAKLLPSSPPKSPKQKVRLTWEHVEEIADEDLELTGKNAKNKYHNVTFEEYYAARKYLNEHRQPVVGTLPMFTMTTTRTPQIFPQVPVSIMVLDANDLQCYTRSQEELATISEERQPLSANAFLDMCSADLWIPLELTGIGVDTSGWKQLDAEMFPFQGWVVDVLVRFGNSGISMYVTAIVTRMGDFPARIGEKEVILGQRFVLGSLKFNWEEFKHRRSDPTPEPIDVLNLISDRNPFTGVISFFQK